MLNKLISLAAENLGHRPYRLFVRRGDAETFSVTVWAHRGSDERCQFVYDRIRNVAYPIDGQLSDLGWTVHSLNTLSHLIDDVDRGIELGMERLDGTDSYQAINL